MTVIDAFDKLVIQIKEFIMSVRVRYAPSPTGLQHIGGVRTALFNYFFARSSGGKFILRVEDTDQGRYTDESLQDLYDTFRWLDIKWDEGPDVGGPFGPYVQSERVALYHEYTQKLLDSGLAYHCFCSEERLEEVREVQKAEKSSSQGYDRHCRELSKIEIEAKTAELKAQGKNPVVRFKIPLQGSTVFEDILLGKIKRDNKDISPDPIIMKADGFPTYHLANIVDDHLMEITHILRAQEWIPSGSLHVLLYQAFGWEPPKYCHLPMVMGKDGQKLSKRHGSTSLRDFIREGYLPEAIINYVTMVGWSYDDSREFFDKADLEKLFSIEKINKAPGVFDYKKLDWFNGQYMRKLTPSQFVTAAIPFLAEAQLISNPPTPVEQEILTNMTPLVQERIRKFSELPEMVRFLFKPVELKDPALLIPKKLDVATCIKMFPILDEFTTLFFDLDDEAGEIKIRELAEANGFKLGDLLMPLRTAVTCSQISPPIFGVMRLLGKEVVTQRLKEAKTLLEGSL